MASLWFVDECAFGLGVFAARPLQSGKTILRFRGRRFNHDDPIHQTSRAAYLLQTGRWTYILPEAPGLLVNHSCNPNAGLLGNRRLVALRDIAPGEEIRFDYSTTMDDGMWTLDCRCGEPGCRGTVTDFHLMPARVREHYLTLGVVQGFIARRYRPKRLSVLAPAAGAGGGRHKVRDLAGLKPASA